VQTGQNGQYVYVVKQDRSVESRPVVTGARVEQEMVIDQGLTAGETVVREGQLRLAPGSRVTIRDGRGRGQSAAADSGAGSPAGRGRRGSTPDAAAPGAGDGAGRAAGDGSGRGRGDGSGRGPGDGSGRGKGGRRGST